MLILGLDTGGTFTDGVILDRETKEVLFTAKALTTREDLSVGIGNCIRALAFHEWDRVGMIGLSTTLATNAVVEGEGGRTGLLVLGGRPEGEIPADLIAELGARVDIRGGVSKPLEEKELERALLSFSGKCDAVAVSGYASVRNPDHEKQAAEKVRELLGLPVVCAHELSGALGFYERTVTAVLNARLIPMIRNLIQAVGAVTEALGIRAPLMIVRGNGSLMRAAYAGERPVETVLSGPAASVMGAHFLSGEDNCLAVDMGGTTTDIACLEEGHCRVSEEGIRIAGWKTRVKALEICTFGLGGDSGIRKDSHDQIKIGPRRVIPFCRSVSVPGSKEGIGFTPTDILHVTGEYVFWDRSKSLEGIAQLMPDTKNETAARKLRREVVKQLTAYCQESLEVFEKGRTQVLVGVGAPAGVWLRAAAQELGMQTCIPPHADVANAAGAAVGKVRETSCGLVRPNKLNDSFYVYTERGRLRAADLQEAKKLADETAVECAGEKARFAGAEEVELTRETKELVGGDGSFVEWRLEVTASGYPQPPTPGAAGNQHPGKLRVEEV